MKRGKLTGKQSIVELRNQNVSIGRAKTDCTKPGPGYENEKECVHVSLTFRTMTL